MSESASVIPTFSSHLDRVSLKSPAGLDGIQEFLLALHSEYWD